MRNSGNISKVNTCIYCHFLSKATKLTMEIKELFHKKMKTIREETVVKNANWKANWTSGNCSNRSEKSEVLVYSSESTEANESDQRSPERLGNGSRSWFCLRRFVDRLYK